MSETDLQRAILTALSQMGVWAIRIGSVGRRSSRGARSGEPGVPDIWTPHGWLEVKLPKGVLSPEQHVWHARAKKEGVRVEVVRSVLDATQTLFRWRLLNETFQPPPGYRPPTWDEWDKRVAARRRRSK